MNRREGIIAFATAAAALAVSFAANAQATTNVTRYDAYCLSAEKAAVTETWANEDLDKREGWNRVIRAQATAGWEPFQVVAATAGNGSGPRIAAVCFKRPAP